MKLKVKKKVKIILIVFILLIYLISKGIIYNQYNNIYKEVKELTKNGKVLDKNDLTPYRSSQFIFLDQEYKIGINYLDIEKKNDDGYTITNLNNVKYTIRYSIKESENKYKEYFEIINSINRLTKKKNSFISLIITLKNNTKELKKIKNNIPSYNEIAILDGHDYNGYIYKIDNVYNSILYGDDKIIEISFIGNDLEYDYITNILSTIEKD